MPEATPAIAVAVDANGSPGEHGNLRRRRTVGDVVKVEEMAHGDEMKKIATIGIAPGP
ncbi:MAG: hypothetical protein KDE35_07740 [Geminicoccaceae bacterium]|nr:hypothetical protein [Geminicoccaceae bacterium]